MSSPILELAEDCPTCGGGYSLGRYRVHGFFLAESASTGFFSEALGRSYSLAGAQSMADKIRAAGYRIVLAYERTEEGLESLPFSDHWPEGDWPQILEHWDEVSNLAALGWISPSEARSIRSRLVRNAEQLIAEVEAARQG